MARKSKYKQKSDGRLYCDVIDALTGRRVFIYGRTDAEIDAKLREFEQRQLRGERFGVICDEWEEEHFADIARGTQIGYKAALRRAKEELGDTRIREIYPLDIKRLLDKMKRDGFAASTVSTQRSVLQQVFAFAVMNKHISVNPVTEVKIPRGLSRTEREAATPEQCDALCNAKTAGVWCLFANVLRWCGLRRGEALALRYEDFDRVRGTVTINKKLVWDEGHKPVIEDHTKTAAGMRETSVPDILMKQIPKGKKGYIFTMPDRKLPTSSQFEYAWLNLCRAAGLTERREVSTGKRNKRGERMTAERDCELVTPHQLRHAYATMLFDANVDPKAASREMGHSKESVTRDIYTHISEKRKNDTRDILNRFIKEQGIS